MTRQLTTVYVWGLLIVLFGMVLHAPLSVYFGTVFPDFAEAIKAWKEILLFLLALPACILLTRQHLWGVFLKNWVVRLALVYIVLHIGLSFVNANDLPAIVAGLMIDLRFIAFLLLCMVAGMTYKYMSRDSLAVAAGGAMVVLAFGLLQIVLLPDDFLRLFGYGQETIRPFTTIDRNPDFVRINSTLRGPNPLGAICVVYLALALTYLLQRWRNASRNTKMLVLIGVMVSVAVLFASYSRSAYVAAILALILVVFALRAAPSKKAVLPIVSVGAVVAIAGFLLQQSDWYSNVILHEDPESSVVSKSNDEHLFSIGDGVARMISQPFGAGIGSTGSASLYDEDEKGVVIENYYLFVAHESGWFGLGLFLALSGLVLYQLWQKRGSWPAAGLFASGVGLIAIGLLLPVWADETVALTWWGLVGGILGSGYAKRTRK